MNPNSESIWRCQSCEQESPWKIILKTENKIKYDLNVSRGRSTTFKIKTYINSDDKQQ